MAWLERDPRTGIFKVGVHLADGKLKKSLKTTNRREANAIRGTVENTLTAIERGWLTVSEDADFGDFLVSGGKTGTKPTVPRLCTIAKLFKQYFESLPAGSLEESTLCSMRVHEKHLVPSSGNRSCCHSVPLHTE